MGTNLYLYAVVDAAPSSPLPAGIFGSPLKTLPVGDLHVVGEPLADPRVLLSSKTDRMPQHAELVRALQAKLPAVMPVFYGTTIEEERVGRLDAAHLRRELDRVKALDSMQVDLWGTTKRLPKRPKANTRRPLPELPELEWITAATASIAVEPPVVALKFLEDTLAGKPTWVREEIGPKSKLDAIVAVITQTIARGKDGAYRKALDAAAAENDARLEIRGPLVSYGQLVAPKAPKAEAPTP